MEHILRIFVGTIPLEHSAAFPKAAKQIAEIEAELEAAEVGGLGLPAGMVTWCCLGQLGLLYIAGVGVDDLG